MLALSKLVSKPEIGRVYIDRIEWTTRQVDENNHNTSRNKPDAEMKYVHTNVTSPNEVQHVAVVTGRIPVTYNNYRDAVNRINNIITTISSGDRVESVSAINLPVEVRPEKKFASASRLISSGEIDKQGNKSGQFSLKVVMKAPDNV
jgi:hypothetical protein